jgi:hypothetical protein
MGKLDKNISFLSLIIVVVIGIIIIGAILICKYYFQSERLQQELAEQKQIAESKTDNKSVDIRDFDLNEYAIKLGILETEFGWGINPNQEYIDLDGDNKEEVIFTISSGGTAGNLGPFILKIENDELVELKIETDELFFKDAHKSCGGAAYVVIENRLIRYFSLIDETGRYYNYIGARYILYKLDETKSKFIVDKVVDLGYNEYFREKYEDIKCKAELEEAVKQFGLD